MAEVYLNPGEIRPIDYETVDMAKVHIIGAWSLADLGIMDRSDEFALEQRFKVEVFDSNLQEDEDAGILTDISR